MRFVCGCVYFRVRFVCGCVGNSVRDVVCLLSYGFFPCTGDGLLQRTIYPLFSRLFCGERLRVATSLQPLSNVQLQGPRSKVCWIFHSRISGLRFRSTVVTCGCACALRGARAFLPYRGPKRIRDPNAHAAERADQQIDVPDQEMCARFMQHPRAFFAHIIHKSTETAGMCHF